MILLAWVLVTTTLLISVDGKNGCPSVEELIAMAKALTDDPKAEEGLAEYNKYMAEAIGNISAGTDQFPHGIERFIEINERFQDITTDYGRILLPEPKGETPRSVVFNCNATDPEIPEIKAMVEKFTPALNNLSNLVNVRFEEARQQAGAALEKIKKLLTEHELSDFRRLWTLAVVPKMKQLRIYAEPIVEKKFVHSRALLHELEKLCMDSQASPTAIATIIWAFFGAGCKNPPGVRTTTTIGEFCDRDHPLFTRDCTEVDSECYAEVIIERDDYDHRTAANISTVVNDVIIELSAYHSLCVKFTYGNPKDVKDINEIFFNLTKETLDDLSKIIMAKAERYWPHAAEKVIKNAMSQESDLKQIGKLAQQELDEKFFWFRHQTLAFQSWPEGIVVGGPTPARMEKSGSTPSEWQYIKAYHYRYASPEDKTRMEKKGEEHKKWIDSYLTGNYSAFTVNEFIKQHTMGGGVKNLAEVLSKQANEEFHPSRMDAFVNMWAGELHTSVAYVSGSSDCASSCSQAWGNDFETFTNAVFLFMNDN